MNSLSDKFTSYTYAENKSINIVLQSPREEKVPSLAFLTKSKENIKSESTNKKYSKKLPDMQMHTHSHFATQTEQKEFQPASSKTSSHKLPVPIKDKNELLTKRFNSLRDKVKDTRNLNKRKEKKSNEIKNKTATSEFSTYKLNEIYSCLKYSRNPFEKNKQHFNLDNIKQSMDTYNRNIEKNRLKEHLKKVVLDGVYVQSKIKMKDKTDEFLNLEALENLTLRSNIALETLYSNLPTAIDTKGNMLETETKRESDVEKRTSNNMINNLVNTNSSQIDSTEKSRNVYKSGNQEININEDALEVLNMINKTKKRIYSKGKGSSTFNFFNNPKKNIKKIENKKTDNESTLENEDMNKVNISIDAEEFPNEIPKTRANTFNHTYNNKGQTFSSSFRFKEYHLSPKFTNKLKTPSYIFMKDDNRKTQNLKNDKLSSYINTKYNPIDRKDIEVIKNELKSEEEFNRDYSKEYTRIISRIEREKKSINISLFNIILL